MAMLALAFLSEDTLTRACRGKRREERKRGREGEREREREREGIWIQI